MSYASEYLNNVEFTQKRMDENITWSGREWITDKYPPRISKNAIEFTDIEEKIKQLRIGCKIVVIFMYGRETII